MLHLKDYFQPESLTADGLSSLLLCWDFVLFKLLLNWLWARWYSSVMPFLWDRSLMFHRTLSSLVDCGEAHLFLSQGFLLKARVLTDREIQEQTAFVAMSKLPFNISKASQWWRGSVWKPSYCVWSPHSDWGLDRWGCPQFLCSCCSCLGLCVRLLCMRCCGECYDSSVLICRTSAVFPKVLMMWERDHFLYSASGIFSDALCLFYGIGTTDFNSSQVVWG